jgi:hypothetical protein
MSQSSLSRPGRFRRGAALLAVAALPFTMAASCEGEEEGVGVEEGVGEETELEGD